MIHLAGLAEQLAAEFEQPELLVATVNLQALLENRPGMPPMGGRWTLSFGMPDGTDDERLARVDQAAAWMGAEPVWRNNVYMAQRDMGFGRLILDAHYTPTLTKTQIASRLLRGKGAAA